MVKFYLDDGHGDKHVAMWPLMVCESEWTSAQFTGTTDTETST
jgi:hypothetical protein